MAVPSYFPTVQVRIALDQNPQDSGTPSWTDWTDKTKQVQSRIGKQHELDPITPGQMSLVLEDTTRGIEPGGGGSVVPGRSWMQVRATVGATTYNVANGWVDHFVTNDRDSYVYNVKCTDGIGFFSRFQLPDSAWDYEVNDLADVDHWYRFDEKRGTELIDRIGTADGEYQIKDDTGTNTTSGTFRKFKTKESMIEYDPAAAGYDMGEHNLRLRNGRVARCIVPAAAGPSVPYVIGIWVQSYEWPEDATTSPQTTTSVHQPVWVYDNGSGNAWEGGYVGLYISNGGDFIAVNRHGGTATRTTITAVAGAGKKGWDGEPHVIWVIRESTNLRIQLDNFARDSVVIGSGGGGSNRILVGGYLNDTVNIGTSSPFPYFIGQISDIVIMDGTDPGETACRRLYQAATFGIGGQSSATQDTDVWLDYIADVCDWQVGRNIQPGTFNANGLPFNRMKALDYMQLIETTELGMVFCAQDGDLTMLAEADFSSIADITIGNRAADDIHYSDFAVDFPEVPLINRAEVEWWNGSVARDINTTSRSSYGEVTAEFKTMLPQPGPARTRADLYTTRYATPTERLLWVEVQPHTQAEFDDVLALNIGDMIDFTYDARTGSDYTENVIIRGIEHTIGPAKQWTTRFYVSPDF